MKQVALVTGASSGIGKALTELFCKDGRDVIIVARDKKKLEEQKKSLEAQYNVSVLPLAIDLSLPESPQLLFRAIEKEHITVSFLINNAGFGLGGAFLETDWKREKEMMQVNMVTLTELTKLFLPSMVDRKEGRILNVASTAAFLPGPLMAVYYASKAYVLSFSEAIAEEVAGTGVSVTALCPGPTATAFGKTAKVANTRLFSGRKLPTPDEVAAYGYNAMMRGERVVVHGTMNKLQVGMSRFVPENLKTKVVKYIQRSN